MATIVTRAGKGSTLTHAEMDANFNNLNNEIATLPTESEVVKLTGDQTISGDKNFTNSVGIGVSPKTWTNGDTLQVGGNTTLWDFNAAKQTYLSNNVVYSSGWNRISDGGASWLQLNNDGSASFRTSGSGTAGTTVNALERMSIEPTGQLKTKLSGSSNVVMDAYACRAWANFNGTLSSGHIRDSQNISSIAKNGTGNYIVSFINAMSDANYAILLTFARTDAAGGEIRSTNGTNMPVPSGFSIGCNNSPGTASTDHQYINLAVFK